MTVVSAVKLNRLLARATTDYRDEPAFFQALLKASVYAHVPKDDPVGRRFRFIQFNHPETGVLILPFFTDEVKARAAAGTTARVVAVPGRMFLEATLGATLMLNPNDEHGMLYPEEVKTLLATGRMARLDKVIVAAGSEPVVKPLETIPPWLADLLLVSLAKLRFVELAYMATMHAANEAAPSRSLLAIATEAGFGERAVHAVITDLQPACEEHQMALDITYFEPGQCPPWIGGLELTPIYDKKWGERLLDVPSTSPN
jgi:hypothetical protein